MFLPTASFAPCRPTLPNCRSRRGRRHDELSAVFTASSGFQQSRNTCLSAVEGTVVFEPVVNVPALGSFLFISIIFSFLILRVRQVEQAVERRKAALADLRETKSKELSSGNERPNADTVARALKEYEDALKSEENLRTLIPGVRVVAPNQPAGSNEEDVAAAKQFLGIDLAESSSSQKDEDRKGLSAGSVAILAVVALSQLALLYMLSFDPMDTFSTLGGAPPADLPPPSSW